DLLRLGDRAQDHVHVHARDHRGGVDRGQVAHVRGDPVEDRLPQLGVRALAPAEHDRDLDLVTALEEPANVVDLRLVVVVVDLHAELDRLHLLLAGALARLLHLLLLLETVATVVEELGDGRLSRLAHQYEVEVLLPGTTQRVPRLDDAYLLTVGADETHLPHPDLFVHLQFSRYESTSSGTSAPRPASLLPAGRQRERSTLADRSAP